MERVINKQQILDRLAGAVEIMLTIEGEYEYQRGVQRGASEKRVVAGEANEVFVKALKAITNIPNGPDRGSAQSQIDCAVQLAQQALKWRPKPLAGVVVGDAQY